MNATIMLMLLIVYHRIIKSFDETAVKMARALFFCSSIVAINLLSMPVVASQLVSMREKNTTQYNNDIFTYTSAATNKYILVVDKLSHRLNIFESQRLGVKKVKSFEISIGKSGGDKRVRGDFKTPEGIYLFTRIMEDADLAPRYGIRAFATNYPSPFDRLLKKTGSGIWVHGLNRQLKADDTRGCIALENHNIEAITPFIAIEKTPIIITKNSNQINFTNSPDEANDYLTLINEWADAWQSKDIDRYMAFYAQQFHSGHYRIKSWRRHKDRLAKLYQYINIRISKPSFFRFRDSLIIQLNQHYENNRFTDLGRKHLYLARLNLQWKIVDEKWRPLTNDERREINRSDLANIH